MPTQIQLKKEFKSTQGKFPSFPRKTVFKAQRSTIEKRTSFFADFFKFILEKPVLTKHPATQEFIKPRVRLQIRVASVIADVLFRFCALTETNIDYREYVLLDETGWRNLHFLLIQLKVLATWPQGIGMVWPQRNTCRNTVFP